MKQYTITESEKLKLEAAADTLREIVQMRIDCRSREARDALIDLLHIFPKECSQPKLFDGAWASSI